MLVLMHQVIFREILEARIIEGIPEAYTISHLKMQQGHTQLFVFPYDRCTPMLGKNATPKFLKFYPSFGVICKRVESTRCLSFLLSGLLP